MRRRGPPHTLIVAGLAWAVGVSLLLLWVPVYAGAGAAFQSGSEARRAGQMTRQWGRTLSEVNGPEVYLVLAVPVALAAMPWFIRRGRAGRAIAWGSGALLGGFVLLAGFTIGLFYVPSAVAVLFAAAREPAPPAKSG